MGRIVDLAGARTETLAETIASELRSRRELLASTVDLDDVDRWRKAARRAGRLIGSRVRTFVSDDGRAEWAVALDHEHDPLARRAASCIIRPAAADGRGPQDPVVPRMSPVSLASASSTSAGWRAGIRRR